MLVKLFPEQVNAKWDAIAPMMMEALPPMATKDLWGMSQVLRAIMAEELTVWAYKVEDETRALLTTCVYRDVVMQTTAVLIYTFYGLTDLQLSDYRGMLETLTKSARKEGHRAIVAFTSIPALVGLLGRIGFRADFALLEYEV